jgi:hypothetical protein
VQGRHKRQLEADTVAGTAVVAAVGIVPATGVDIASDLLPKQAHPFALADTVQWPG